MAAPRAPRLFLGLPALAKLNLFLHVTGRRADGYHELQSVFVPLSLADVLDFELTDDGRIERSGDLVGPLEGDLVLRAAQALRAASGTALGAAIHVEKLIPAGSGLGGGSSDAATTLIALNRLWGLDWPRQRLAALATSLGADVPFFLGAGPAWVEGIGERLTPLAVPPAHYLVVHPQVHVSTREIFTDPGLTRSTKPLRIEDFSAAAGAVGNPTGVRALFGANDLEPIVRRRVPEVEAVLKSLSRFGPARMTGSGSAVFVPLASEQEASAARATLMQESPGWWSCIAEGLDEHPLGVW
ncbi:MAG: 4-(cytidine 5'-diphospho)-2-C-methyl-D-erythritol kinase [Betaproteobacteria bacterium]